MNWTPRASPDVVHVYWIDDVLAHNIEGGPCWCNPAIERIEVRDPAGSLLHVGRVVTHSAASGLAGFQVRPYLHGAN